MVCFLRWFFCLLGCRSFHFVPCFPPFWGAFVFLWLVGFHHHYSFIWVLSMLFKAILKTWTPRHVWKLWILNITKWHIDIQQCKNVVCHLAIFKNFHCHSIHEREWFSTHWKPKSLSFKKNHAWKITIWVSYKKENEPKLGFFFSFTLKFMLTPKRNHVSYIKYYLR